MALPMAYNYGHFTCCTCVYTHTAVDLCISLLFLSLKVLVASTDAQWEGMGDVGSARYEPALLPPFPTIRVLSYSFFDELQNAK